MPARATFIVSTARGKLAGRPCKDLFKAGGQSQPGVRPKTLGGTGPDICMIFVRSKSRNSSGVFKHPLRLRCVWCLYYSVCLFSRFFLFSPANLHDAHARSATAQVACASAAYEPRQQRSAPPPWLHEATCGVTGASSHPHIHASMHS